VRSGFEKLAFDNIDSARIYMERRYKVVVIKLTMMPAWSTGIFDLISKLRRKPMDREELVDFFHNLAVMQRSGIPILEAMQEMASEESGLATQQLAKDVLESLASGASLSESFNRHPDVIPETARFLVQIGENSGALDRTLLDAANHLKRVGNIVRDTKRVMIYPAFVFLSIIGAALFWMVYVIPSIADLFRQMRIELPALTQWVMTFSENLSTHFTIFIIVVFALIYGAHTAIRKSYRVRYQFHKLLLKLPVSKVLIKSSVLAFITEYLSLLISSGINIVDSLEVIERSTKNEVYREKINQIRKGVSRGNSLSDEIRFHQAFPGFVIRMISVGEQSGSLDQQLRYLAEEYRQRFDHVVASISEIIKPLVMLIAGGLFILMIVALFLPIYQLIGQVQ
jgi:general secretion pathway protein F/type IV pilus assembly protein PilC